MRRRVRVHQAELRSRQVPRSLSAPGSQTGSQRHPLKPIQHRCFPNPPAAGHRTFLRGRCPGRGSVSGRYRLLGRAGRRRRSGHPNPPRPTGRADPGGKTPASCRNTVPKLRVAQAPVLDRQRRPPNRCSCSTWPMALTERSEQPVNNPLQCVLPAAYAQRVYGEFALHLWHRTAGSPGPGGRRVHRARG